MPRQRPQRGHLSWAALRGQFGQEYADPKKFKRKFLAAEQKAEKGLGTGAGFADGNAAVTLAAAL